MNRIISSRLSSISLGLHIQEIINVGKYALNFGFGASRNKLSGERRGLDSGEKVDLPGDTKLGIFYCMSVSREQIFNTPIKIEILFKHSALMGGTFATDIEQPFTGSIELKELHLNLLYVF